MGGQATMADIAAELGVSRQLVSLVLRDQPGASEQTRVRVKEAATRLGYSPHAGARLLRQYSSRQLGVVFDPAHATEHEIVQAIYGSAAEAGYQVVLSATTEARTGMQAVEELLGYRCAALVVIGADLGPDGFRAVCSGPRCRSCGSAPAAATARTTSCARPATRAWPRASDT